MIICHLFLLLSAKEEYKIIDVSYHQGNINWTRVKEAGIEGAIIRSGISTNKKKNDDEYFLKNVKGCIDNDIPFGISLYSYAETKEQVESEARHVIRLAEPYKNGLSLPIFYELEYENKELNVSLGKYAVENGKKFIEILENNGYKVGIYSSQEWINNYIKDKFNDYPLWISSYGINDGNKNIKPIIPNDGKIDIWQYTDKGVVDGINGYVKINACYRDIIKTTSAEDSLIISGNEQITPLNIINCGSNGADMKFYKNNFHSGNFNAFNIYSLKSNLCQKSTTEMMEEMIRNYGTGSTPEYHELFERIYNIVRDAKISMTVKYENKEGNQKYANALCYGTCRDGSISRLSCFFQGDDINTNKKIYSGQLNGYAAKNKCNFEKFLDLNELIIESEEDDESDLNEADKDKIEIKESIYLTDSNNDIKNTQISDSTESNNDKDEEEEKINLTESNYNEDEENEKLNPTESNYNKDEENEKINKVESSNESEEKEKINLTEFNYNEDEENEKLNLTKSDYNEDEEEEKINPTEYNNEDEEKEKVNPTESSHNDYEEKEKVNPTESNNEDEEKEKLNQLESNYNEDEEKEKLNENDSLIDKDNGEEENKSELNKNEETVNNTNSQTSIKFLIIFICFLISY